jgi:hypothetical protein
MGWCIKSLRSIIHWGASVCKFTLSKPKHMARPARPWTWDFYCLIVPPMVASHRFLSWVSNMGVWERCQRFLQRSWVQVSGAARCDPGFWDAANPINLFVYLYVCGDLIPYIYIRIHVYIYRIIYMYIYMYLYLIVFVSICIYMYLSIYQSIYLPVCLSVLDKPLNGLTDFWSPDQCSGKIRQVQCLQPSDGGCGPYRSASVPSYLFSWK